MWEVGGGYPLSNRCERCEESVGNSCRGDAESTLWAYRVDERGPVPVVAQGLTGSRQRPPQIVRRLELVVE